MTEPANEDDEWWSVIGPFFDGPKTSPPDVKALARLLRKANPQQLPAGFLETLAEMLESVSPSQLACNWQLRPVYIGRYDKELLRERKERLPEALGDRNSTLMEPSS